MTMDDTRVIHLKLNFVQTELPQTSSPSPFSPWPTRAKILAEFCRVFSSKTQVYCICTRRTTTTAYYSNTPLTSVLQYCSLYCSIAVLCSARYTIYKRNIYKILQMMKMAILRKVQDVIFLLSLMVKCLRQPLSMCLMVSVVR